MPTNRHRRDELTFLFGFFREALVSTVRSPRILSFALLATLFGMDILSAFPGLSGRLHDFLSVIESGNADLKWILTFLFGAFLFSLLSILFRTSLLLSVGKHPIPIRNLPIRSVRPLISLFLLEAGTWLTVILFAALLLSPSEAAQGASLSDILGMTGGLILIIITVLILFSRTFALFHIVLSEIPLPSALRLGYALFRKHTRESILFALVSGLIVLFTSLLIGTTTFLFDLFFLVPIQTILAATLSLAILTLHVAVQKCAWVAFFRHISEQKKPCETVEASQESEKMLQREVPETGKA